VRRQRQPSAIDASQFAGNRKLEGNRRAVAGCNDEAFGGLAVGGHPVPLGVKDDVSVRGFAVEDEARCVAHQAGRDRVE